MYTTYLVDSVSPLVYKYKVPFILIIDNKIYKNKYEI